MLARQLSDYQGSSQNAKLVFTLCLADAVVKDFPIAEATGASLLIDIIFLEIPVSRTIPPFPLQSPYQLTLSLYLAVMLYQNKEMLPSPVIAQLEFCCGMLT